MADREAVLPGVGGPFQNGALREQRERVLVEAISKGRKVHAPARKPGRS